MIMHVFVISHSRPNHLIGLLYRPTYNVFLVLQLNLCRIKLCPWLKVKPWWELATGWWDESDDTALSGTGFGIRALAIWGEHARSRSRPPPPTPQLPPLPPPHTHKHTALHLYESQWKHILLLWNWNTKVYLVLCYTTITKHVFMVIFSWLYRPPCHWWIKFIFCTNIQALAQRIGDRHLYFY